MRCWIEFQWAVCRPQIPPGPGYSNGLSNRDHDEDDDHEDENHRDDEEDDDLFL